MKKILLLSIAFTGTLFFSGCYSEGMTNEQIIEETKKCNEAGMGVREIQDGWNFNTQKIICTEKD